MSSGWLKQRRAKIAAELKAQELLVLFTSTISGEQHAPLAGDFSYLSDYWGSGTSIFVLTPEGQCAAMFTDALEKDALKWRGAPVFSAEQLELDILGNLTDAKRWLTSNLPKYSDIYTNFEVCSPAAPHPWLQEFLAELNGRYGLHDSRELLAQFRVVKDSEELTRMQKAAQLAYDAIEYAVARASSRDYEYQIAADFGYWLHNRHSIEAFPTIVAQGANGGVMHYEALSRRLVSGETILIDAGCRWHGYCSDISRTIPYDKPLDIRQQEVFYWVRRAQSAVMSEVKPGASWQQLQMVADACLAEGLKELGVVNEPLDAILEQKLFKSCTVHRIGHWLGIDVHDVGGYQQTLRPGMVLTVEPGLYLSACKMDEFIGINVRLEDDVVVTEDGSRSIH